VADPASQPARDPAGGPALRRGAGHCRLTGCPGPGRRHTHLDRRNASARGDDYSGCSWSASSRMWRFAGVSSIRPGRRPS
jgi:hypothetical protein